MVSSEFEKNPLNAFPHDILEWINLIMLSNNPSDNIKIIGSIAYRKMRQFADVDLMEIMNVGNDFTAQIYHNLLKQLIYRMESHGAIYSDMKLGFDEYLKRYTKDMGYLQYGLIHDFNRAGLINELIHDHAYYDTSEVIKMANDVTDTLSWEALNEKIRCLYTLHWSKQDIYNGYVKSVTGKLFDIKEFLTKEALKLDFFINVNGDWIEISTVHNININDVPLNYNPIDKEGLIKSIQTNTEKFLFSPLFHSLYKGLKRCWILSRLNEDSYNGRILSDLINSDVNNLYIAKSYLETIALMLTFSSFRKIDLTNIKWLISHCTSAHFDVNQLLTELSNCKNVDDFVHMKKELTNIVNKYAYNWILKNNFLPTIQSLIGETNIYNHKI